MNAQEAIEEARNHIRHGCDGPLTPFVLICRATELVRKGADSRIVADALHEELTEFGWLSGENNLIVTGS